MGMGTVEVGDVRAVAHVGGKILNADLHEGLHEERQSA